MTKYANLFNYIIYELGDEMPLQFRHVINFWKFGAFAFVIAGMVIYNNYSLAAYV